MSDDWSTTLNDRPDRDGVSDRAVRALAWSILERWGARAISTATFVLIARHVSPAEFGLVALASSVIAVTTVVQQQGFGIALIQAPRLSAGLTSTAFWSSLLASCVLAVAMVALATPISLLLSAPGLTMVIQAQALGMIVAGTGVVPAALLQRSLNFRPIALRRLLASTIGGCFGLVLAIRGWGVWALVAQGLLDTLVSVIVLWIAVDWRPRLQCSLAEWRQMSGLGGRITFMELLNVSNRRLDDFLIGTFLGPVALGYYAVAYKFLMVMTELFISVVSSVTLPAFSRLQRDPERARDAMATTMTWTCAVALPAFAGLALVAPNIVSIAFGDQWSPSVPVMQVLAISGLIQAVKSVNGPVLIALGRAHWVLNLTLAATVLNAVGFGVGLHWGILGVAVGSVARGFIVTPLSFHFVRRATGLDMARLTKAIAPVVASTTAMCLVVMIAQSQAASIDADKIRLATVTGLGLAAYGAGLGLTAPWLFHEGAQLLRRAARGQRGAQEAPQ